MGLLDLCRRSIRCLRAYVGRWAPPGTKRRAALARAYYLLGLGWLNPLPPRPRRVPPLEYLYDRESLNRFLAPFAIYFPERLRGPVTPDNAARRVLELLLIDPELHERFPQAIRERSDGEFARWLFSGEAECMGVSGDAARLMVEALDRRPGVAVQHWYDHHPHAPRQFPLGLTPADRIVFFYWLLTYRTTLDLTVDQILWFNFELAEDPACGLGETFRRLPAWQEAVPHGLTRLGWQELKSWVASRYRINRSWLHDARCPEKGLVHSDRGVNLLGHLRYPSGLQIAALNTAAALESAGYVVSRRDVPNSIHTDLPGREGVLDLHPYPVTLVHLAPEPLAEDSYRRSGLTMRKDTYRIGYWYWEMEDVPRRWNRHASWIHELWAPTRFIGQALRRVMKIPVIDMLAGMRMPPVVNMPRSRFGLPDDRFLFLFVFDMGSTMERKNPLAVIEAFRKAFSPKDQVALAIKVARGTHNPAGLRALQKASAGHAIHLIDALLSHDELFGLMNTCDAYASLHRSEGYGLTMAETMALGKPVIATGYSGNLDFMTPSNSLLVSYSKTPLRATVHIYRRGGSWAEPSVDHAAELMRWVVAHPAEARALGQRAARDVRATLSLEAAGQRMAARLDELSSRTVFRAAG